MRSIRYRTSRPPGVISLDRSNAIAQSCRLFLALSEGAKWIDYYTGIEHVTAQHGTGTHNPEGFNYTTPIVWLPSNAERPYRVGFPCTLMARFWPTNLGAGSGVIFTNDTHPTASPSGNYSGIYLSFNSSGQVGSRYGNNGGDAAGNRRDFVSASGFVSQSRWNTLAAIWHYGTNDANQAKGYINGRDAGTLTYSGSAGGVGYSNGSGGIRNGYAAAQALGMVGWCAVFNRALSPEEIVRMHYDPWHMFKRKQWYHVGFDPGQTTDADTVTVVVIPSGTELAETVDAATAQVVVVPSGTELQTFEYVDTGQATVVIEPSGTDIHGTGGTEYEDSATASVVLLPSGTEFGEFADATTGIIRIQPTGTDVAVFADTGTIEIEFEIDGHDCHFKYTPNFEFIVRNKWTIYLVTHSWTTEAVIKKWIPYFVTHPWTTEAVLKKWNVTQVGKAPDVPDC